MRYAVLLHSFSFKIALLICCSKIRHHVKHTYIFNQLVIIDMLRIFDLVAKYRTIDLIKEEGGVEQIFYKKLL